MENLIKGQNASWSQNPKIIAFEGVLLAGFKERMTLSKDLTPQLWRQATPVLKKLSPAIQEFFNVTVYDVGTDLRTFDVESPFNRWAACRLEDIKSSIDGLEKLAIPAGTYAVFDYKGAASGAAEFFGYALSTWLLNSGYSLEARPQFEVLGRDYDPTNPDSTEKIWIPLRTQQP